MTSEQQLKLWALKDMYAGHRGAVCIFMESVVAMRLGHEHN